MSVEAIRSILGSGLAAALKRFLRDLYWGIAGARIRNPALPAPPRSLLFLCYGNICRSAYAGLAGQRKTVERGTDGIVCDSAGLRARDGTGSPTLAVQAARERDVDLRAHRSRTIDRAMVERYDMVLVMEVWQLRELRRDHPHLHDRLFLLPLLEAEMSGEGRGYARYNLADPYGQDLDEYRECFGRIDRSLDFLFGTLCA